MIVLGGSSNEAAMAGAKEGTSLHTIYYQKMAQRGQRAFVSSDAEARERLIQEDNLLYFGSKSTFLKDRDLVRIFVILLYGAIL